MIGIYISIKICVAHALRKSSSDFLKMGQNKQIYFVYVRGLLDQQNNVSNAIDVVNVLKEEAVIFIEINGHIFHLSTRLQNRICFHCMV